MARIRGRSAANIPVAAILVVIVILLWGLAHRLYSTLLPVLGTELSMSPGSVTAARVAVLLGYFLFTLPTAFISRNYGYKLTILAGLGIFAVGIFLFYLAALQHSFAFLVLTATVMGSGLAIVSVAAGPFILFCGPAAAAVERMNLAEGFSALGGAAGLILAQQILATASHSASIAPLLVLPLSVIGALSIVLAYGIENTKLPAIPFDRVDANDSTWASFAPLLRHARFRRAVLAMMLVLFTQSFIGVFAVPFGLQTLPQWPEQKGYLFLLWAFLALGAGRFAAPVAVMYLDPMKMAFWSAAACLLCTLAASATHGYAAVAFMVASCFFVAVLIPTIFASIIYELGVRSAKSTSALITFATFSGTGILFMGTHFLPAGKIHAFMLVPALCLAGIALLIQNLRRTSPAAPGTCGKYLAGESGGRDNAYADE
jgi:Fucose permease